MSEEIILATRHGNATVPTMNYRPHDLMGPTPFNALRAKMREATLIGFVDGAGK